MDISMGLETILKTTSKMIIKNNQEVQLIQVIYQGRKYMQVMILHFQKNKKFN
jgi:hypothetical protein